MHLDLEKVRATLREKSGVFFEIPVANFLFRLGVSPNMVTIFGLLVGLGAAVLVGFGMLWQGGLVFLFSALFDTIDGALARKFDKESKLGGYLDSIFDRIHEGALLIALIVYFGYVGPSSPNTLYIVLSVVGLFFAYTFSYVRAITDAKGLRIRAGFFTRTERVVVMALFLILSQPQILVLVFITLAIPSTIWRFIAGANALKKASKDLQ